MSVDPQTLIGLAMIGFVCVLGGINKLNNDRVLLRFGLATITLAAIAMILREPGNPRVNKYDVLLGPAVYVVCFGALRALYKRAYRIEPTSFMYSWYDPLEGRQQNWLDVITHAIPFMVAFGTPPLVTHWLG